MILLNILIIQFIIVGVSYSGFWEDGFEPLVKKMSGIKIGKLPKLFYCEFCQTWWVTLLYIIFSGHFTLPYIAACMAAAILTPVTLGIINLVKDIATNIITCIYKFLGI